MSDLKVVPLKRSGKWVIVGTPWRDVRWCGPYKTKREALSAIKGIRRAIKNTGR